MKEKEVWIAFHGNPGSVKDWQPLKEEIKADESIDLRPVNTFSIDDWSSYIKYFEGKLNIVAHSFGCLMALKAAKEFSGKVDKEEDLAFLKSKKKDLEDSGSYIEAAYVKQKYQDTLRDIIDLPCSGIVLWGEQDQSCKHNLHLKALERYSNLNIKRIKNQGLGYLGQE